MTRRLLALLSCAALTVAGLATAAVPPAGAATAPLPTRIGQGTPVATFVDRHGTSFVLVQDELFYAVLYRRTAAGKSWIKTKIPHMPAFMRWGMYAPTANVLWITAEEQAPSGDDGDTIVSRSTDGGKTWAKADVSRFASGGSRNVTQMAIVGNLVAQAHFTDGSSRYIRLHPDLKGYDAWPANAPAFPTGAGVAGDGRLMTWLRASAKAWTVTAGSHSVSVSFPCNQNVGFSGPPTAVGAKGLVMLGTCGSNHRVYARYVSSAGEVGAARKLGVSNGAAQVAAGKGSAYAVAWGVGNTGDVASAHSAKGSSWTITKGELPISLGTAHDGGTGSMLVGNKYFTFGTDDRKTWATSLGAAASRPPAPTHGIRHPRTLRNGTAAAVVAKKLPYKALRKKGVVKVRVRTTVTDKVSIEVETNHPKSKFAYIYVDSESAKVVAGKTKTFTLHLHSGATVIGGPGGSDLPLTSLKHGDLVAVSMTTRNGLAHATVKVS